jgi:hypothetical protein
MTSRTWHLSVKLNQKGELITGPLRGNLAIGFVGYRRNVLLTDSNATGRPRACQAQTRAGRARQIWIPTGLRFGLGGLAVLAEMMRRIGMFGDGSGRDDAAG